MNKQAQRMSDADPNAIRIAEAQTRIRDALTPITDNQIVQSSNALGRVLAHAVTAPIDVPPFRSAAMDGYAFRHADATQPLFVDGQSLAGHPGADHLTAGQCQRITTGARVPDDADTVVMQENTHRDGDQLNITQLPTPGFNVRVPGSDSACGEQLLAAGKTLRAAELGMLAAHGITEISVRRRLRVAVLSTGDELCDAGSQLASGQIFDANRALLQALLTHPAVDVTDLGIRRDNPAALQQALVDAGDADVLISSGGVSVGDADYVRAVLGEQGRIALWKIAMKPGRPLAFGFANPKQAWFGLPGNPVSSAITCLLFVLPAIRHLLSQTVEELPGVPACVETSLHKLPGRVEYQRGMLQRSACGTWHVSTTGLQDSHVLSSLHKANCLVELGLESSGADVGEIVNTIPFAHLGESII